MGRSTISRGGGLVGGVLLFLLNNYVVKDTVAVFSTRGGRGGVPARRGTRSGRGARRRSEVSAVSPGVLLKFRLKVSGLRCGSLVGRCGGDNGVSV